MIKRPEANEIGQILPEYLVELASGEDYFKVLDENTAELVHFIESLPADKENYAYAEGKWTVKEVLQHICDVERVMSFRAFVAARTLKGETLPNMDHDLYQQQVNTEAKEISDILQEFKALRAANYSLFQFMTEKESLGTVTLNKHSVTARTFAFMLPGHAKHHLNLLKERYL